MTDNDISWKLLNTYFKENPDFLIKHHLDSYNDFFDRGLSQILKETNPIHFYKKKGKIIIDMETKRIKNELIDQEYPITYEELIELLPNKSTEYYHKLWGDSEPAKPKTLSYKDYNYQTKLYMGGVNGDKIYYGKPVIASENGNRFMYPNEARLKNFTYSISIHYDIYVEIKLFIPDGTGKFKEENKNFWLKKIYMGKFPIMLKSKLCILHGMSKQVMNNMGEDPNDTGGYFIVDGKEKVIISQDKFADNALYIQKDPLDDISLSARIRSVSENASKPVRTLTLKVIKETPALSNGQIVVTIPNVRKDVPLFIVMRALGVVSDKDIIEYCLLDIDDNVHYLNILRPSIHDAGHVFTQEEAINFITTFTKNKTTSNTMQILMNYLLPHVGELNFKSKAYYLGYIVKRMLMIMSGESKPTNRDSYIYKRIENTGSLISDLFKEYYSKQQKDIFLQMDQEYFYAQKRNSSSYQGENFINLIKDNRSKIFSNKIVEDGFKRGFKGDWGSESHTKKIGALQDLSRLSYFATLSQMRKINTPIGSDGAKVVGPRVLNSTQWGILCPLHSPDGGNIGLHKYLSIMAYITKGTSGYPFIKLLKNGDFNLKILEECTPIYISNNTKVFINGFWIGITTTPKEFKNTLVLYRRNGIIDTFTSIYWDIELNELKIHTDAGRPCHPLLHVANGEISYENDIIMDKIKNKNMSWKECIEGISEEKIIRSNAKLEETQGIIEYLDTQEMQGIMLVGSTDKKKDYSKRKITHKEIHESVILSMLANQIIFPSTLPYPRSAFSCGQTKQAVSVFNTNYKNRTDKTALLLNYGQDPIVRSRYYNHVTKNQHPYGTNAMVAIACYSGYNVEDAIIINKSALDRGLFRTTYFNTYESKEEKKEGGNNIIKSEFMNIDDNEVIGLKPGYDYSNLKPNGLIEKNTYVNEKTILMGKTNDSMISDNIYIDESVGPKKGQIGYVEKSFITLSENGNRIAKIQIRNDRIPGIGDKFCSRAGQKGTIGIVLPESDMPFTEHGLRPDIIVNPHAFPSRMTIGHLIEVLIGKAGLLTGALGDCTAFLNKGLKEKEFGKILSKHGFSSTSNEIMYNGMTGEQLESDIYIGPTYYLRLKHMVKDKINYRSRGPRTALTRQTVQGRANDGGLRIGEMDRDAIIAHGMKGFMYNSMMERGDKYYMAICNNTGTIAIYNENKNIFLSPTIDGPLKFKNSISGDMNVVPISKYGRNFSVIKVPYAFKLLYQELQAMNVQMRIITSDNVEELTSLKGDNKENIIKLTGFDDLKSIDAITKQYLTKSEKDKFNYVGNEDDLGLFEPPSMGTTPPTPMTPPGTPPTPPGNEGDIGPERAQVPATSPLLPAGVKRYDQTDNIKKMHRQINDNNVLMSGSPTGYTSKSPTTSLPSISPLPISPQPTSPQPTSPQPTSPQPTSPLPLSATIYDPVTNTFVDEDGYGVGVDDGNQSIPVAGTPPLISGESENNPIYTPPSPILSNNSSDGINDDKSSRVNINAGPGSNVFINSEVSEKASSDIKESESDENEGDEKTTIERTSLDTQEGDIESEFKIIKVSDDIND